LIPPVPDLDPFLHFADRFIRSASHLFRRCSKRASREQMSSRVLPSRACESPPHPRQTGLVIVALAHLFSTLVFGSSPMRHVPTRGCCTGRVGTGFLIALQNPLTQPPPSQHPRRPSPCCFHCLCTWSPHEHRNAPRIHLRSIDADVVFLAANHFAHDRHIERAAMILVQLLRNSAPMPRSFAPQPLSTARHVDA